MIARNYQIYFHLSCGYVFVSIDKEFEGIERYLTTIIYYLDTDTTFLQRCSVQNVVQPLDERTGPAVEVKVKYGSVTIVIESKERLAVRITILMKKR